MSSADRLERFRLLLGRYLGMDPARITPELHLSRDLGLDALDLVLISVRLEEFDRVEVPVSAIATAATVADFVNAFHEPPESQILPSVGRTSAGRPDATDSWLTFPRSGRATACAVSFEKEEPPRSGPDRAATGELGR